MPRFPQPPCVDPEMKNALAIERNTASITALTQSFQKISSDFDSARDELADLRGRLQEIIVSGTEKLFDEKLKEEQAARIAGDAGLKTQCDMLNAGKAGRDELDAEKLSRADADLVLQARIQSFEGLAARLVASEASERKGADGMLDARITVLERGAVTVTERIEAEEKARSAADAAIETTMANEKADLTSRIDSVSSSLTKSFQDLEDKNASQDEDIASRATRDELEAVSAKASSAASAIEAATADIDSIEARVTAAEGRIAEISALEGMPAELDSVKADILEVKEAVAEVRQTVANVSARETSHYETLSGRIDGLERMLLEFIQR